MIIFDLVILLELNKYYNFNEFIKLIKLKEVNSVGTLKKLFKKANPCEIRKLSS